MVDNRPYINSATLIADIYNDYNIQSDDFIPRFPIWIANALDELKFLQAFIIKECDIEFEDNRCELPWGFQGAISVLIDGRKISLKNSAGTDTDSYNEVIKTVPTYTPFTEFPYSEVSTIDTDIETPAFKTSDNSEPYYYISSNWIHTNIKEGTLHLTYKSIPVVYDSNLNMEFPLIYDVGMLKRYLKLYVVRQILLRGYKHPVLNLKDNNPIVNPGLELMNIRSNVRVACNKFNKDRREAIAQIVGHTFLQ